MSEETKDVLVIVGTIIYVICPFDFDFIPLLGWVDDAAVVGWAIKYFADKKKAKEPKRVEQGPVKSAPVDAEVIDVECRRVG